VQWGIDVLQLVLDVGAIRREQRRHGARRRGFRRPRPLRQRAHGRRDVATIMGVGAVRREQRREVLRSARHLDDVVVPGDDHDVEPRLPVHRALRSQRRPRRVGVVDEVLLDAEHAGDVDVVGVVEHADPRFGSPAVAAYGPVIRAASYDEPPASPSREATRWSATTRS
jgi:hypothetical protein